MQEGFIVGLNLKKIGQCQRLVTIVPFKAILEFNQQNKCTLWCGCCEEEITTVGLENFRSLRLGAELRIFSPLGMHVHETVLHLRSFREILLGQYALVCEIIERMTPEIRNGNRIRVFN